MSLGQWGLLLLGLALAFPIYYVACWRIAKLIAPLIVERVCYNEISCILSLMLRAPYRKGRVRKVYLAGCTKPAGGEFGCQFEVSEDDRHGHFSVFARIDLLGGQDFSLANRPGLQLSAVSIELSKDVVKACPIGLYYVEFGAVGPLDMERRIAKEVL